MAVNPIGVALVVEAIFFHPDFADIDFLDSKLIIDNDWNSPSVFLIFSLDGYLLLSGLINHFLESLPLEHLTQERELPRLIVGDVDHCRHFISSKAFAFTWNIVS